MSDGVFLSLSKSYLMSAKNTFYYLGNAPFLLKPIALIIAVLYAIVLIPVGAVFGALIVFDWVGGVTDSIRKALLELMDKQSWSVDNSLMSFLLRPILLVLIAPLFLLSVFIPKLSSNALVNMAANEVSDIVSGAGAFKRINEIIWRAAHRLFVYVSNAPLLLKPLAAIVAVIYSIVLIVVGAVFFILIPLDWVSRIIESARQWVVRFANEQQQKIRYSGGSFLFAPLLLVILAPVFLAIILVPKFTTNIDVEA